MNDRCPNFWNASSVALSAVTVTIDHTVNTRVENTVMDEEEVEHTNHWTMSGNSTEAKTITKVSYVPDIPAEDEVMFAVRTQRPFDTSGEGDRLVPILALPDVTARPFKRFEPEEEEEDPIKVHGFPDIVVAVPLTLAIAQRIWEGANPDEYEDKSGTLIVNLLITIRQSNAALGNGGGNAFKWEVASVEIDSADSSGSGGASIVVDPKASHLVTADEEKEINLRTWKNRDGNSLDIGGSIELDCLPPSGFDDIVTWVFDCEITITVT